MLNLLSVLIGLVVAVLALIGFVPLLGWLNWATIPVAIVGLVIGTLSSHRTGRNLNLVLVILCGIRLAIGGSII